MDFDSARASRLFLLSVYAPLLFSCFCSFPLCAQENFEIQVYGSRTAGRRCIMTELHSNFTFSGSREKKGSLLPTQNSLHETVEITYGWNDWFETGFYIFTSRNPGYGWQWVGDHIRPRVRVPDSWRWPVGTLGPVTGFNSVRDQQQQILPVMDLNFGPHWEFNLGVGLGVTRSTDHLLVKAIFGRRFNVALPRRVRLGPWWQAPR